MGISRRNFFKLGSAAALTPLVPPIESIAPVEKGVEVILPHIYQSNKIFYDVITDTLRNRSGILAENITRHNALLLKLEKRRNA